MLRSAYDGTKKLTDFKTVTLNRDVQIVQVPCGKCVGCRLDASRQWADRMTYHSIGKSDCSYFFTLTYGDDWLPDASACGLSSLDFDHQQKFIKDLRNRFRDAQIDFYMAGEYGDQFLRPHFHAIVYNLFIPDLTFWKLDDQGQPVYTSEIIHGLWKRGICSISEFTWSDAAYTARYVMKKLNGDRAAEYTACGLIPEQSRMSRRPGIAHDFYLDHHSELWSNEGLAVDRSVNKLGKLGIPRYFRKLAEKYKHFDELQAYKQKSLDRVNVLMPLDLQSSSFDLDRIAEKLQFEERSLLSLQIRNKL